MKKLSIDHPFFCCMGNLGDMILLNLIFLLTCIPVITIGTAQTALYRVMLRRVRKESSYPVKEYLEAFKDEWKQGTASWLPFLVIGGVLIFDVMYLGREWSIWGVGTGVLISVWCIFASYVFPVQAQFENTTKNIWRNAAFMAVRHFPCTILIVFVNLIPVLCFLAGGAVMQLTAPIYLTAGFSLAARVNAELFGKIFKKCM